MKGIQIKQLTIVVSIILLLLGCAKNEDDSPDTNTPNQPLASGTSSPTSCCKICSTGKACGNSCISRQYSCSKGVGCACNKSKLEFKLVGLPVIHSIPYIIVAKIDDVSGIRYSSGSEFGVVDKNGYYTYEEGLLVTFTLDEKYFEFNPELVRSFDDIVNSEIDSEFLTTMIKMDIDSNLENGIQL